jgi:hypothetical protein
MIPSLSRTSLLLLISDLFYLLVSKEAMVQLNLFPAMLHELMPTNDSDSWTVLGSASVKVYHVYQSLMGNLGAIPALKWMRDGCCQQR